MASSEALNMVSDIQSVNNEILLFKSQSNLMNNIPATSSHSSLDEMDEVEIIIDLNTYHEGRQIEAIDERLKNIVMHMIPTTRKAYVDDICEGIKSLLSGGDLREIRSPIDLPNQVIN